MLDLTDWQNKKFQTRNGDPVRILCIDAECDQPIIGLVKNSYEEPEQWSLDGTYNPRLYYECGVMDLINAKTKREGWLNIYQGPSVSGFINGSREEADKVARSDRVACIHIEWEE